MNYSRPENIHSDTSDELVALVRHFVDTRVIPVVKEREHEGSYAADLLQEMAEMGLPGLPIPEEYGGFAARVSTMARVFEELGRGWIALADMLSPHYAAAKLLSEYGTEGQKKRFLPQLANGQEFGAIALTEPSAGSDLRAVKMVLKPMGGSYELHGSKTMITHASHAHTVLTLARLSGPDSEQLVTVILRPFDDRGVTTTGNIDKLGHRGVDLGEIICENTPISADRVLGETPSAGGGLAQVMGAVNDGRIYVGSGALGMAQRSLELALTYTAHREAYGLPLSSVPAVRSKLSRMWLKLSAARAMMNEATKLIDQGAPKNIRIASAAGAKILASEAATELSLQSMQLHGGYGYTREFDIERIFRDAPLTTIGEGANDMLLEAIAKSTMS